MLTDEEKHNIILSLFNSTEEDFLEWSRISDYEFQCVIAGQLIRIKKATQYHTTIFGNLKKDKTIIKLDLFGDIILEEIENFKIYDPSRILLDSLYIMVLEKDKIKIKKKFFRILKALNDKDITIQ
jgi:hypothetical protein